MRLEALSGRRIREGRSVQVNGKGELGEPKTSCEIYHHFAGRS